MFRSLMLVVFTLGLLACVACGNSGQTLAASNTNGAGSQVGSGGSSSSGSSGTGSSGSGSASGSGSSGSTGSSGSASGSSGSGSPGSSGSGSGSGSSDSGSSDSGNTGSGAGSTVYVYVSGAASATGNQITGFSADSDGRLTEIAGSPFDANDGSISSNGSQLFGASMSATNLDAYSIGSNGALTFETSTNYQKYSNGCGGVGSIFPDLTGADLYTMEFDGDCANNYYQSFATTGANGSLNYLGTVNGGAGSFMGIYLPATFLSTNQFAYEATNNSCMYYAVQGFARNSSGLLVTPPSGSGATALPAAPPSYRIYIPTFAAADASNHVAITMLAANPPGCDPNVQTQIGSFTADENGNLTTTNTYATMPSSSVINVTDLKISPAGNLIAVGGQQGLQLLHFNGAGPVTPYTGVLTVDPVAQMFWDNQNHLYVLSQKAARLHVFTVTATSYAEAPGSPYSITKPNSLAVDTPK